MRLLGALDTVEGLQKVGWDELEGVVDATVDELATDVFIPIGVTTRQNDHTLCR